MGGKISKVSAAKVSDKTKAKSASKTSDKSTVKKTAAKPLAKVSAKAVPAKKAAPAKAPAKAAAKPAAKKPKAGVDENGTFRAWDNAKSVAKKPAEKKSDFVPGTTAEQTAKKLAAAQAIDPGA